MFDQRKSNHALAEAVRAHMQVAGKAESSAAMWNHAELPERGDAVGPYQPTGNEKLDALVRALNPVFRYGATPGNVIPGDAELIEMDGVTYYRAGGDVIDMPHREQFRSDADYRAVLAHELTHWTAAYERAPRPHDPLGGLKMMFGSTPDRYEQEEVTAELGAALLLEALGEDPNLPTRAAYAAGWAGHINADERERAILDATRDAERAVDWMLAQL